MTIMKKTLIALLTFTSLTAPAFAQDAVTNAADDTAKEDKPIIVTGSRIKRMVEDSPLPLQVITTQELKREGINSPEQLVSYLSTNGTGLDNLASNADVVSGQARGNNGASSANLRGQGAGATLVLLNGRRVAAHGLNGGAVDVNQIPFAAVERVEILKDGASAIYGTDAIGGVMNFILKKDYTGFGVTGFVDATQKGGGNIYRTSAIAGYGDLDEDGFNIMGTVSYSWNKALRGDQRKFVNTFQPDRGLSVDTRGTPFATFIPLAGTAYTNANAPLIPGRTDGLRYSGGINLLDLPGAEGCGVVDGQAPYDAALWAFPQAAFACAWDTGRAAVLQQPLETLTYVTRGVVKLGDHEISAEFTGSKADAAKRFSNLQITPNTSTQNYAYRRNASNASTFDALATRLTAAFPTFGPALATTPALSYRWRCIECGPREIETSTKTSRFFLGMDGPIAGDWEYKAGASYATSSSKSKLGTGYYFRGTLANGAPDPTAPIAAGAPGPGIIGVLNSGLLNPFLFPGQTQSQQALDMLKSVSAEGVTLYGGRYAVLQLDYSVSGSLFELPGGKAQAAIGIDYRQEKYKFNGDARAAASRPVIIAAPFDDGNALAGVKRDIKAVYAEVLLPIVDTFELTGAVRLDDYTGFGTTVNPKFSFKYKPIRQIMFRGSYNTGFRAPSFNQIFNGVSEAIYTGRDLADPARCPGGVPTLTIPNCQAIQPNIINGGRIDLGPETAKQGSLGVVFTPTPKLTLSVDWWRINREDTIQLIPLRTLLQNYSIFQDSFIRDGSGTITAVDQRIQNAGQSTTQGLEFMGRFGGDLGSASWNVGMDGTYLLKKKERVFANQPYRDQIGKFDFGTDLGLRWKHNAFISLNKGDWGGSFSQVYRSGYDNQILPGVADGTVNPPNDSDKVKPYVTYNFSLSYEGFSGLRVTAGVKNVFDKDPPFAVAYDSNTGAGSSWEPRVADPRGRAFTLLLDYKF
jgi:iron complex outermembrane recepter protein